MPRETLIVSCEHAGRRVPGAYAALFTGRARLLASHRGSDIGALTVARRLAGRLDAPLLSVDVTRLLIDANRSPHHRELFSSITRALPAEARRRLFERHYLPHRRRVEERVACAVRRGTRVLHVAVHSFAPVVRGKVRRCDLGLLYDPSRSAERRLCQRWQRELRARFPDLVTRRNHPYRGSADGLTTALRKRLPGRVYLGIEVEVSQIHAHSGPAQLRSIADALVVSLAAARVPLQH